MQSHRISTNIGEDQLVTVELKQDYDLLEILSLKFSQQDVYTSLCSDYGVVCGRISVNNGLGIPNARVSIFVPQKDIHANDPVISLLYPYTSVSDKDENGYRYNLLPSRQQHSGQEATGTFPDQRDILTREEYLEVYEHYYSYTVKTNNSGDFMIWGVPLGYQTIHVDVDLSDIGCFSLRPDDFIRQGMGVDKFTNSYKFKASNDLSALPQIVSFDKSVEVYPFWGNVELCDIGITRTDFDLSEKGVKVEPKAYFLGSIFSDQGNNAVNKNCTPTNKMGDKCSLISEPAQIEVLRFTPQKDNNNRPILEVYELNEDIGDDGAFVLPVPMNMDYMYTDEFGENVITNDPNRGVPTSGCYRFRISTKNQSLGRVRTVASYLVPNIREYTNDVEKSYAWSTNWTDYPSSALNNDIIFRNEQGAYNPNDYFYRFNYNKVYGVSSFMGSYFSSGGIGRSTYLGIKEISPKTEDDCENSVVTPPVNFGIQKFTFAILIAIILNTFERLIYYAFIAAVQVLILPFQTLYNFRIYIKHIIDWRPFGVFDKLVIEPLQRFGTVRLGIAIYPECETCDNLDYSNELPSTSTDPADLYTEIGSGICIPDNFMTTYGCSSYTDGDELTTRLYFNIPSTACSGTTVTPTLISGYVLDDILNDFTGRYIVKFNTSGESTTLNLFIESINGINTYYFDDTQTFSFSGGNPPTSPQNYKIYDSQSSLTGGGDSTLNSELEGGCQQYVTAYDETMVSGTYCVTNSSTPYSSLTAADITNGISCAPNKFKVGQVIKSVSNNPCNTCSTKSGYSEFRYGLFTIVPAAATGNWEVNFKAVTEYSKRKLVAKLFCEGVSNYSFLDNWLTGSLYFFPFKAKVRWDDEAALDLNYARTKYCTTLLYFKVGTAENPDKRFYYRSTRFNGTSFDYLNRKTLNRPTTIVDLGPRDEFIKEICTDASLDPNCSVVRNIGPSSYQNFKEMLGLYINYKMDYLGANGSYTKFFDNDGFNGVLPNKMDGYVLNGDILQLISINNEAGIEEFDLQNRNYAVYSPQILDVEEYPTLLDGGPMPINLVLDDGDGYRVRACLNEPGRLTEASQDVPFFLWNKNGTGFGSGTNQSWYYTTVEKQPLQGMTYGYKYNGDTTHKYILLPMTKEYSGNTFTYTGISFNDVQADIQTTTASHTNYDNQEEGFTVLEISSGTPSNPVTGTLYIRTGETGNWASTAWTDDVDFLIKPTSTNYDGNYQILSTPFLFYFGLRPGKTAVDKFIERFGPLNAFPKPIE
jgi:hypothetical protein